MSSTEEACATCQEFEHKIDLFSRYHDTQGAGRIRIRFQAHQLTEHGVRV